jgi:hypothetical protein
VAVVDRRVGGVRQIPAVCRRRLTLLRLTAREAAAVVPSR